MSKTSLDIVIPVYNEEQNIPLLAERLEALIQKLDGMEVRVILVDDHSTDDSPRLLKEVCTRNHRCSYLRLSRNSGSHVAILAGLKQSRADCCVFLASDMQDPPELIPKMIDLWQEGKHVVWAVRDQREGTSSIEKLFSNCFYSLLNRFGEVSIPPQGSDFALLDRKIVMALIESVRANLSLGGEIARLGFDQGQIPYTKERRRYGKSKWTLERKLRAFADAFVSFTYMPLRLMSYAGMLCSLLGFLYAFLILALRLIASKPVQGWTSLMVVVLVLGGIQMTMLGVLGEYLWRTLEEARRRPHFFIEESYEVQPDANQRGNPHR